MLDFAALRMVLGVLTGWIEHRERETIAYLIEGNRLSKRIVVRRSSASRHARTYTPESIMPRNPAARPSTATNSTC